MLTDYHALLLYKTSVKAICTLNEELTFEDHSYADVRGHSVKDGLRVVVLRYGIWLAENWEGHKFNTGFSQGLHMVLNGQTGVQVCSHSRGSEYMANIFG